MLTSFKVFLIVPMLFIGTVNISTIQVTAMQVINQNMSQEDLKEIMSNLVTDNNTPLTDESIDFISKLSDKAEQILNNNTLDDLIKKVKDNQRKNLADNYNDFEYLLHCSDASTLMLYILDSRSLDIYTCINDFCIHHSCNNCTKLYINFLKKLKGCFDKDKITKDKYRYLLKYLLYLNTYHFCKSYNLVFYNHTDCMPYYAVVNEDIIEKLEKPISESNANTIFNIIKTEIANWEYYIYIMKYGDSKTDANKIVEQLKRQESIIALIIDELINTSPSLPADAKLSARAPSKIVEEIKMEILPFIVQGFRDLTYFHNYEKHKDERVNASYINIFNIENKVFCEKIDNEFNITNKIKNNKRYTDYVDNFNNWATYHSMLVKNLKPKDKNKTNNGSNSDTNSEGEYLLKKVKDNINKLNAKQSANNTNAEQNYGDPDAYNKPLPGSVYKTILPYLVHTEKDYKKPRE